MLGMRNLSRIFTTALPAALLAAALLPATSPANAASPSITLSQPAAASPGATSATLRGRVSGIRGKVTVQTKTAAGWQRVTRVKARGSLKVRVRLTASKQKFRVVAKASGRTIRSRVVTVRTARAPKAVQPAVMNAHRTQVLSETNTLRASRGLAGLSSHAKLDQIATAWARRMATSGELAHNPNYLKNYPKSWRKAGENVAVGYSANQVTQAWANSPGHLANLVGDYTHVGIGYAVSPSGVTYWVQNFARL